MRSHEAERVRRWGGASVIMEGDMIFFYMTKGCAGKCAVTNRRHHVHSVQSVVLLH